MKVLSFFAALGILVIPTVVAAEQTLLYFSPSSVILVEGETTWVDVMVDTGAERINAIGAYFSYPAKTLEAIQVDTKDSVMTLVAEQKTGRGYVRISGGKPTPGFTGVHKVGSVEFRALSSTGAAHLVFDDHAVVLRDSDNQDALDETRSAEVLFSAQASQTGSFPHILIGGLLVGAGCIVALVLARNTQVFTS
ncbi:MAG: hypothetical protein MN733_33745 [Nitrososphaera sp.]|nr:hypothetical protein [Nitrososphaera sp.]